jgi:hypothetical protein
MSSKTESENWFTELFLFVLRLVVYSGSSFLAKVLLSLYGLIHSLAVLPGKKMSAAKSLFRYGVAVIQKWLGQKEAL